MLSRVCSFYLIFLSPPDRVSASQHLVLLPFLATAWRAAVTGVAIAPASVLFAHLGSSLF